MGCFDEGHFNGELENGVSMCSEVEDEANTTAIEDAVKVLLLGLGEDINREGLKKTPIRVAKALREGTRGNFHFLYGFVIFNGLNFDVSFMRYCMLINYLAYKLFIKLLSVLTC
jgi:hypothetical protein